MPGSGTIRVIPSHGRWAVKKDGNHKASSLHDTKEEAYSSAREIALRQGLDIIVHWKDGKIQKRVKPKESDNEGCYITTACVSYYNLTNDCRQLETLRSFRDVYLLKTEENSLLVQEYYERAPELVQLIDQSPERAHLYEEIFARINLACTAIEDGELEQAKLIYVNAVQSIWAYFNSLQHVG